MSEIRNRVLFWGCILMFAATSAGSAYQADGSKITELNNKGVAAYKQGRFEDARSLLESALSRTDSDNRVRLEILDNLWVTYLRLGDKKNAEKTHKRYAALAKQLDTEPDIKFTTGSTRKRKEHRAVGDSGARSARRRAKRQLTVSGLALRTREDQFFVVGNLINTTNKPFRDILLNLLVTMDDTTEEFESVTLKGIGPSSSKPFEKKVEPDKKGIKPVMVKLLTINSVDLESSDVYKMIRK